MVQIMKTIRNDKQYSNITRRCQNDAKGAYSSERYYASILRDKIYLNEPVLQNTHGGIIIFSTDINPILLSNHYIVNLWMTKMLKIADENLSWTIAKTLHVKYKDRVTGEFFNEDSLSIVIFRVSSEGLLAIAENFCTEFNQRVVLVKSHENNDILCVNGCYNKVKKTNN